MEESGHYYTVYFTSLAVGFDKQIAYRHAVLAQMPDQVEWLDAATMHVAGCFNGKALDLSGQQRHPADGWRFLIEYALHSLPDRTSGDRNRRSETQQDATTQLLMNNRPDSLEFGLLLHRLGDTFAHSRMGDVTHLYTVSAHDSLVECTKPESYGHALDGHDPDYPFLRPPVFYAYLRKLYRILYQKVIPKESRTFRRHGNPMTEVRLEGIFRNIIENPTGIVNLTMKMGLNKDATKMYFIQQIRKKCAEYLNIDMEPYAPEIKGMQKLNEFLADHKELKQLLSPDKNKSKENEKKIVNTITDIRNRIGRATSKDAL